MLRELSIRNFAIIEDLNIRFEAGLTILSGETGAGKSIIINAVNLLLGSRASAQLIRTGAESAELEALFDTPAGSSVAQRMVEAGFDAAEGLLVRRIISNQERHRIYINGRLATMQLLSDLTARLASISGQHAHQGLLKEEAHLFILDQFGDLLGLRDRYREAYDELLPLIREERSLRERQARQDEQVELLRFQLGEIEAAAVQPDEDEALEKERLRLKNGEALYQTVHQCIEALYSGDGAVFEALGQHVKALGRMGSIDDQLQAKAAELEEVTYRVEDIAGHLREYLQRIDLDPGRLEAVEERLDLLSRLKRKYGGSLAAVGDHAEKMAFQLEEIEALDDTIAKIASELKKKHHSLCRLAKSLSGKRRKAAERLSGQVERELAELKMEGTRFVVDLQPVPAGHEATPFLADGDTALTESGSDRAVFMIAPNVGETIKPLAGIASGGELSRVVLALKAILAHNDALETVVFDEVDAGIGGGVADVVGRKLAGLAGNHQILCITHLPQIARYGAHHFCIAKSVGRGRTRTTITPLTPEGRIEEMARMLGGEAITATTMAHAREMLSSGR
jgi:DNA repair protein RecN (Recombination protein N)